MLWNASQVCRFSVQASDGPAGNASDLLFDDTSWLIRWLVVDALGWLTGHAVLLPCGALGSLPPETDHFSIPLTAKQIADSPGVETEKPVSREMESEIYDFYGWSPYWGTDCYAGLYHRPGASQDEEPLQEPGWGADDQRRVHGEAGDPHLRSVKDVTGYHIRATDFEIGHVEDFLIDDQDWSVHYLVVATRNWWPGKKVLIAPEWIADIEWAGRVVTLRIDRQTIQNGPTYDQGSVVDAPYEAMIQAYYAKAGASAAGLQP